MQHDLVRLRELITLFRERRVLVVSVVNSLAVLLMACVLGIFLEVNEKRRAYAERVGRGGPAWEETETAAHRSPTRGSAPIAAPTPDPAASAGGATVSTAAPTRTLRARVPPPPRSRSIPPAPSGSRDDPVEVRRPMPPAHAPDPEGFPALGEDFPIPVEDSSSFDFERPPMEE